MKINALLGLGLLGLSVTAQAALVAKTVDYRADGQALRGYLVYDNAYHGERPGVLVVHEWWGLNSYARGRARMLAKDGYTALALDMYGNGKTANHPKTAEAFMNAVNDNMPVEKARFMAAYDLLDGQPTVKRGDIAAIGYCFGGGVVLNMARLGAPLKSVVSFHGMLMSNIKAEPGSIKPKILVFTGGADKFVPAKEVAAFEQEMKVDKADFRVVVYPGAEHSFTNPGATALGKKFDLPLKYDAAADKDSWAQTRVFLKQTLGQ